MTRMPDGTQERTVTAVEAAVSEAAGAPEGFGHGRSRTREAVDARRALFYILNRDYGLSHETIGNIYGFNRVTVLHLVNDTASVMDFDRELRRKIRRAESILERASGELVRISKAHIAALLGIDNDKLIITEE